MRRLRTAAYNHDNEGARRQFAGGLSWRTVAKIPSVKGRGDVLLTFQASLDGIGYDGAAVRFLRVYPNGKTDGTGDCDLMPGQRFLIHQHVVARGPFEVHVQIKNRELFVVRYCYLKATVG